MGKKNQAQTNKTAENGLVGDDGKEAAKGAKSKRSKRKDYDEDEVARELEQLQLEANGNLPEPKDVEDTTVEKDEKSKKTSKKAAASDSDSDEELQGTVGGGFAALMADDGEAQNMDNDEPKGKKQNAQESAKMKKEKGKKAKKKRRGDDDDEDIDELLAQIEAEYTGIKREVKEKDKNQESDERVSKEETYHDSMSHNELVSTPEPTELEQNKENRKPSQTSTEAKVMGKGQKLNENEAVKKELKLSDLHKEAKASETKKEPHKKDTSKASEVKKELKSTEPQKEIKKDSKSEVKLAPKEKKLSSETKTKDSKEESPIPADKDDGDDVSKKKKKTKVKEDKKKEEDDAKARKGKPNKKMLEAMKLMLAKQKEEDERLRKEEEELQRQEDERIRQLEEQHRLEEERKEKLKQKQKERMKRLKEEGKLLTPKQRLEQKRVQAMLQHLKAQGVAIPEAGEKLTATSISYKRQRRRKQEEVKEEEASETAEYEEEEEEEEDSKEEEEEQQQQQEEEEMEDVVDAWDQLSENEEEEKAGIQKQESCTEEVSPVLPVEEQKVPETDREESEEHETEEEVEHQTEAEKRRERAVQRLEQRKAENEKKKSPDLLRAPVVCVLGHVDHGKTKILDKLRRTNVQEGEVGGITQQIGATNVPFEAVRAQTRMVRDFEADSIRLPGLLIIDTPGHESFSNLRTRGSSLCDIAILVVDVTQGLEPQTIESISLLKNKKTPFVVALNKVDRVFEWESHATKDIRELIKLQNVPCKNDFERRTNQVIQALNVQGLNAALFWENPDPRSYVSLVPTSAISGDGMGNLMALITTMCQKRLCPRLMFSEELQCTVLEVKTIQGHGTTIDVILVNGRLKEGDTIILAGTEGPIVTQIRSLLLPKPMKEIRVKGQYDELKVVEAALGVKVAARELEKAIAGLNLQVAHHEDEVEILKEQVDREFKAAMRSMKVKDKGVYVQASTLGALEALLEFFKTNKVPYAGIRVGPVVKRDVMKAAAMLEHDPMYAVILAFDVKVERDAQELADKEGIKIFSEETIYHLGDRYVEYIKEYKKKKQDEFRHVAVFPCRLKIIPDAIFNKRDPIVLGVTVEAGVLRTGTPLCVPSKEFVEIGVVTSLEFDHKMVEMAKKGVNVCMKVEPTPGHTPKLFGRHFDASDMLISKITRESIDACKEYFRDDLGKVEWKLMAELKKQFGIL